MGDIGCILPCSLVFNMFLRHACVPDDCMKSVIIPLVKCRPKTGYLSDVNNYKPIVISTAVSLLFESVLLPHIKMDNYYDAYQFGFTGSSTTICTSVIKRTVDGYTNGGSHVFVSFYYSKAFDKVS